MNENNNQYMCILASSENTNAENICLTTTSSYSGGGIMDVFIFLCYIFLYSLSILNSK